MKIHTMPQRSPEWYAVRLGKITATKFQTMANGKPDTKAALCLKVCAERLTGKPCDEPYINDAMQNGIDTEALARQAYESSAFETVQEVGFIELDEFIGASPDGLTTDGGIEIKCPLPHTHLSYLLAGGNAWQDYYWQVQGALWITGRKWWDFVSFHPDFPPVKQLLIERVVPDSDAFKKLDAGAAFCRKKIAEIMEGVSDGPF